MQQAPPPKAAWQLLHAIMSFQSRDIERGTLVSIIEQVNGVLTTVSQRFQITCKGHGQRC